MTATLTRPKKKSTKLENKIAKLRQEIAADPNLAASFNLANAALQTIGAATTKEFWALYKAKKRGGK